MKELNKSIGRAIFFGVLITVISLLLGYGIALAEYNNSSLSYRSLDYNVQVEENGDLQIREIVDIQLKKREDDDTVKPWKQLYQQYTLRSSNLTNISNISVTNLDTGDVYTEIEPVSPTEYTTKTWNRDYANHWYIADVSDGESNMTAYDPGTDALPSTAFGGDSRTIEIGWNIPATTSASSMRFQIDMTWEGVSTAYNDVLKFQWEPFGQSNQTPIDVMHATVQFPSSIPQDESWAWLHYEGNATTKRTENGLECTAYNVKSSQYLDLIVMFDVAHSSNVIRHSNEDMLQATLDYEAQQEQEWKDKQHKQAVLRIIIWIAIALIGIALCVIGMISAVRSVRAARYKGPIEYWREPPNMSPGAAAQLYDVVAGRRNGKLLDREMASTVMSLVSKGAIAIYPGSIELYEGIDMRRTDAASLAHMLASKENAGKKLKKTSTVVILPRALMPHHEELRLCESEERMLSILIEAYERLHTPVFDLEQMKQAFAKWTNGYKAVDKFKKACEREYEALHATCSVGVAARTCGILANTLGILSAFFFFIAENNLALALCISAPMILVGCFVTFFSKTTGITKEGQQYAGEVIGLARYMEDFSTFSDRNVLDITLWGRYLVYAAAFGISKKVMQQLKDAYPQFNDPTWLDTNVASAASIVYWSSRPSTFLTPTSGGGGLGNFAGGFTDLGTQLNSGFAAISSTISAAAPSSSGSSGGSFSGGSFGGSSGGSGGGSFGGR